MQRFRRLVVGLAFLVSVGSASAAVPNQFTVQGVLRSGTGQLQSASVSVTVKPYSAQTGGTLLASYNPTSVMATNGLFTLTINDPSLKSELGAGAEAWLEVAVGTDVFSRQLLTPEVYALMAKTAESADSLACSGCVSDAMLATGIAAAKITGKVAAAITADTATNATNATNATMCTTASNSAELGGVVAASYALKTDTAPDSAKLGGVAAAGYLTAGVAATSYLPAAGTAADAAKLAGVAAASYQRTLKSSCTVGSFITGIAADGTVSCAAAASSGGTVTNVTGAGPISVTNGSTTPVVSLTSPLPIANGGTGSATGDGSALTNLNGANLIAGTVAGTAIAGHGAHNHGLTLVQVAGSATTIPAGGYANACVTCPAGMLAAGGFCQAGGAPAVLTMQALNLTGGGTPTGVCCYMRNNGGFDANTAAFATCLGINTTSANVP